MTLRPTYLVVALVASLASGGCSEGAADFSAVPSGFPITEPTTPITDLEIAETLTVEIEDRLFLIGQEMIQGKVDALQDILAADFQGHSFAGLPVATEEVQIHHSLLVTYDVSQAQVGDGPAFVEGLRSAWGSWQAVDFVRWDIFRCEIQPGRPTWAKANMTLHVVGKDEEGQVRTDLLTLDAQLVQDRGKWVLHAIELLDMESRSRGKTMFTDISKSAGVGYTGMPKEDSTPFPFRHLRLPYNGAASADINGDGIWDIFASGKERNFLYIGKGDGTFDDQAVEWGVLKPSDGTGAVFFDYDNDGDQDLFVAGEGHLADDGREMGNRLRLYRNEGDHFKNVAEEVGLNQFMFSYSVAVMDYDQDGWLDIYVCNYGQYGLERNNSWRDGNNGDVDALFRNIEGKSFENVQLPAGLDTTRWSFAVGAADYDRDGDQDIYVAHDYGINSFYINQGDGTFKDIGQDLAAEDMGFGMGVCWGDLNNDGLLDLYISNMYVPVATRVINRLPMVDGVDGPMKLSRGNTILLQEEGGTFRNPENELGGIRGMWAWGSAVNDFDLDGRLDIFCSNGFFTRPGVGDIHSYFWRHVIATTVDSAVAPMIGNNEEANNRAYVGGLARRSGEGRSWAGHERNKLWFNRGSEGFLDLSDTSGVDSPGDGRAAVALDIDDDGDLDLFLNEWSFLKRNRIGLYRNDLVAEPKSFLKIQLRATTGQYQAAGAEVIVHTPEGPCSQVLSFGTGFLSSNPPELIFGLGDASAAKVEVIWPGAIRESFGEINAGSRVILVEGNGKAEAIPTAKSTD